MSVGKSSINRAAGKKTAPATEVVATPVAEEVKVEVKAPAKKAPVAKKAVVKAPAHGNYVLITEELPVWLL